MAFEMFEVLRGTEAAHELKAVPLANDTVRGRFEEFLVDIQSKLLEILRSYQ